MERSRFERRVPCVRDDGELRLGPRAMQRPRALHRADDVVASLDDHRGDVANRIDVVEELRFLLEEALVDEVVRFDARERERVVVLVVLRDELVVLEEEARARFPHAPCLRGAHAFDRVLRRQTRVVCTQQIAALRFGDGRDVVLPRIGIERGRAALVEPVDLALAQEKNPAQHELGRDVRVLLRIRERERRAPRATKDLPPRNVEMGPQRFHVRDEIPRGVVVEARVRDAATAPALIEEDDAIRAGVEESALLWVAAAAGTAVDEDDGLAVRVAGLLVVNRVHRRDAQRSAVVRFDVRVEGSALHGGDPTKIRHVRERSAAASCSTGSCAPSCEAACATRSFWSKD